MKTYARATQIIPAEVIPPWLYNSGAITGIAQPEFVRTVDGKKPIEPNNWIVLLPDGSLDTVTNEEFTSEWRRET